LHIRKDGTQLDQPVEDCEEDRVCSTET